MIHVCIYSRNTLGNHPRMIVPYTLFMLKSDTSLADYKLKISTPAEMIITPIILFRVKDSLRIRYANIGMQM